MSRKTDIEIPKSHRNEWKSKRNFENLIENLGMYMPFEWAIRDYGIDGQVEIMKPIKDSDSFRPESKFFLLQLKSKENVKISKRHISFPIPVKKIVQWYSANLPVMFVLNDLPNNTFYSVWIDEKLINELENKNPNWVNQTSVSIKIPTENNFAYYTIETIRNYVLNWKIPSKKIIQPGTYFELKGRCIASIKRYEEISQPFNFGSINNSLNALNNQIEQAIYRIAITGPSRVGKSTLINALLRRKGVSPTGIFQTTGVPIQILPDKEDFVKVNFRNGKTATEKFSEEIIENYASQEKNEDNKKDVVLLEIHLANKQLEQGVSFFDIPGLDDPDENIYNYTWSTVTKANAILYLIDASPFENGGYIFKSDYKKHILELGQSLDKIFLVFTKINALTGSKLQQLQERVRQDLKKYNLYDKVSEKVYFISAEESLDLRLKKKKGNDTVQTLEDDIWKYLLKENKIGLFNLSLVNTETINSTKDFEGILNTRLLNSKKRKELVNAIDKVKSKIPELSGLYRSREVEIRKGITNSLNNRKHNILLELGRYLDSIPSNKDLPDKKSIQNYLAQGRFTTIEETNKDYAHQVNLLKEMIDNWIENNLKQVREIIQSDGKQKIVDFTELEKFSPPTIDLSNSFGMGLLTMIGGFFINPIAGIGGFLLGFFGNLFISAENHRAKQKSKILEKSREIYDEQFNKLNSAYMEIITKYSQSVIDYANNKINSFFTDLQNQMSNLSSELSTDEVSQYQAAFAEIENLRKEIQSVNIEINSWYSSV